MALITLLTDFGTRDTYVASMKGVILSIDPGARIVDLTHEVAAGDVEQAGYLLAACWERFPRGTIHVAVVDPGVGSGRRRILLEAGGQRFVGPDNGLFTPILDGDPEASVFELTAAAYHLDPVSSTFHGRDVFAPVAAWLSRGVEAAELGIPVGDPVRRPGPGSPSSGPEGELRGLIVHEDRFGNLISDIRRTILESNRGTAAGLLLSVEFGAEDGTPAAAAEGKAGRRQLVRLVDHYAQGEADEVVALFGSSDQLEFSVNRGSAAVVLGAGRGARLSLGILMRDGDRDQGKDNG